MTTYVDSGVLVKPYSWEAHSEEAAQLVGRLSGVPLVALHELEIRNALRAQRGRGLISEEQMRGALRVFEEDIGARRLSRVQIDWLEVFLQGERFSCEFTAARHLGCEELITGDARQARLAQGAGLRAVNIAESVP